MIANFQGNPILTTIVTHAPCEYEDEIINNIFYEQLQITIKQVPSNNFLIILSDINAKMGPEDMKYTYNISKNNNESWFKEMMEKYNLLSTNLQFQKKIDKFWTCMSQHMTKHKSDYLLVRNKWRKRIRNCEARNTFIYLGSDHRLVVANVTLSIRKTKQIAKRKPKYVWSDLRDNEILQERNAVEIRNKLNIQ